MGQKIISLPYLKPEYQPNPEIQTLWALVFTILLLIIIISSSSIIIIFKKLKHNFSWNYVNIKILTVMTAARMVTWWKHAMTSHQWLKMNEEKNSLKGIEIFKRVKVRIPVCVNFHSWYNPNKMFSSFMPKKE